jgi:hypothetical protein
VEQMIVKHFNEDFQIKMRQDILQALKNAVLKKTNDLKK